VRFVQDLLNGAVEGITDGQLCWGYCQPKPMIACLHKDSSFSSTAAASRDTLPTIKKLVQFSSCSNPAAIPCLHKQNLFSAALVPKHCCAIFADMWTTVHVLCIPATSSNDAVKVSDQCIHVLLQCTASRQKRLTSMTYCSISFQVVNCATLGVMQHTVAE